MSEAMEKVGECIRGWLYLHHGIGAKVNWGHMPHGKRVFIVANATLEQNEGAGLFLTIKLSPRLLLPDEMSMFDVMNIINRQVVALTEKKGGKDEVET